MKLFLYPLVLFILTACSINEQKFVCGNEGLIITKDTATIAFWKYQFCGTQGTLNMYSTDCKKGAVGTSELYFDTVALTVRNSGSTKYVQCKKIN